MDFLGLPVRCSIPSPREDDTRSWQLVFNWYRTGTYQTITHSLTHSLITLTGIYNVYIYIYIARSSVPNCKAVTSPPFSTSRVVLGTGSAPVPRSPLQVVLVDVGEDDQLLNLVADEATDPWISPSVFRMIEMAFMGNGACGVTKIGLKYVKIGSPILNMVIQKESAIGLFNGTVPQICPPQIQLQNSCRPG